MNKMVEDKENVRRSIVSAVGLGVAAASMFVAQSAEAATQVAQIAESDNRVGVIFTLFVPALGWVGFNMLQPFTNQVWRMHYPIPCSNFRDTDTEYLPDVWLAFINA